MEGTHHVDLKRFSSKVLKRMKKQLAPGQPDAAQLHAVAVVGGVVPLRHGKTTQGGAQSGWRHFESQPSKLKYVKIMPSVVRAMD